jgi:hypothetical protein
MRMTQMSADKDRCPFTTDRRSPRKSFHVDVRIERRDGSAVNAKCFDASEEGFGIISEIPLAVGEIVRLVLLTEHTPMFVARVIWREGPRLGLYCVATKPLDLNAR